MSIDCLHMFPNFDEFHLSLHICCIHVRFTDLCSQLFLLKKIVFAFTYKFLHLNCFEIFSFSQQDLGGAGVQNSIESLSLEKITYDMASYVFLIPFH